MREAFFLLPIGNEVAARVGDAMLSQTEQSLIGPPGGLRFRLPHHRQFQRFGEEIFLDVRVLVHRLRLIATLFKGSVDQTAKVWEAARAEQFPAWQEQERAAAEYLAGLRRERTAEHERQRIARAGDEVPSKGGSSWRRSR